jgi:glycosyltransferase involved in cell wall biosynthesis
MSNVLFWSASDDGSSWYRADLPAEALRWSGHATLVAQQIDQRHAAEADVIVGSRIANEGAARFWLEMASAGAGRAKLVLDLDDAYWSLDSSNPAAAHWDDAQLDRLRDSCRAADIVTVPSEGLGAHVFEHTGVLAKVVPNGLHAGWLGTPRAYRDATVLEPVTIGWSGTASSARDFDLVVKSLANIVNYGRGRVKLRLVGLPHNHPSVHRLRVTIDRCYHDLVDAVEWVHHGQPYLSACAGFDIWVAPYRPDPFVEAKFPTKALEAGFLGIPLIASDVRPYREWSDDVPGGVALVPGDKDWMWGRYLKTMVDSADTRRAIGEAGRSRASANIMQSVGMQWANTLGLEEVS